MLAASTRCVIEQVVPADMESLKRLYTDPACRQYLGGPINGVEAEHRVQALLNVDSHTLAWAIRVMPQSEAMGLITLGKHHDGDDFEVSYLLLPDFQGRGYATQAVRLTLNHAFDVLLLPRVVAETQSENLSSIRLLKRIGMILDRCVTRFDAEQHIYGINASAYLRPPSSS